MTDTKDIEKIRVYHEALADILCWMDGYSAALQSGVAFNHINAQALREMKSDLYGKLYGKAPSWLTN